MTRRKVANYDRTRRKKHWQLTDPPKTSNRRRSSLAIAIRRFLFFGILLYLAFGTVGDAAMGILKSDSPCRLVSVIDGDTVSVWCGGTRFDRARLTGFDTPEVFSPKCAGERWLGLRAVVALKGALWSASRIEIQTSGRDRYDRMLARMTVDGVSVGNDLIARGLARPYSGGRRFTWCTPSG